MKRILIAALAIVAMPVIGASAQSIPEKTGVNSVLGVAPKTQDFVTEAAQSDMLEIATSKLVADRHDDRDKNFAEQMVKDHTQTSSELKGLVDGGKVKATLPTSMDKAHQSTLDDLGKLTGDDFRKKYESLQVSAHKDAVSLFQRYGKSGDNADLKDWAGKTLPTLQGHLKMAQDIEKD
jgi:putative membrane protein